MPNLPPEFDIIGDSHPINHGDIAGIQKWIILVDNVNDSLARC